MTRLEIRARVLAGEAGEPEAWPSYIELAKSQILKAREDERRWAFAYGSGR